MPTRRAKKKPVTESKGEEFFSLPFVVFVKKRCEKFNILFMISPDREIYRDGEPCDGFFEAPEKGNSGILALCIGKDLSQVLHTLAHEFSHVMQWYEDDPIYKDWEKKSNEENIYKLEADTERRALEMLKEWNLYTDEAKERSDKYLRSIS